MLPLCQFASTSHRHACLAKGTKTISLSGQLSSPSFLPSLFSLLLFLPPLSTFLISFLSCEGGVELFPHGRSHCTLATRNEQCRPDTQAPLCGLLDRGMSSPERMAARTAMLTIIPMENFCHQHSNFQLLFNPDCLSIPQDVTK